MARREDSAGYGTTLPATTARLVELAAEIMGDPDPDELAFIHSALAQTYLPYRQPPADARDYHRTNGRVSLVVSAGYLADPRTGEMVLQGIPYGSRPRLLMLHLCSEAIRRQSAVVPIADSMSAFMKALGLQVTGGKRGTVGRFKEQLNRLAAARLQMGMAFEGHATTINAQVVEQFDVWFPDDPRQKVMWPSTIVLSEQFFGSLKDHALPLDPRGIRALQHSARALDIYAWLAHRLPRVKGRNGDKVSWAALQAQFGGDMQDRKQFRRDFKHALTQAHAVYPRARVDQVDGGLQLRKSPPPIHRKVIPVAH